MGRLPALGEVVAFVIVICIGALAVTITVASCVGIWRLLT